MLQILIVDDEEVICKTIELMIRRIESLGDVKVLIAYNGIEALDIIRENEIDIVLTDICMEEMDGMTLIEKITEEESPPKIIAISAYDNFEYVHDAFMLGIFDYIMKPVDFSIFAGVLEKCTNSIKLLKSHKNDVISKAKQFVTENIEKGISLIEVSNHVSLNYNYFSKYFKRVTGESFSNYLTSEKMKYCKKLLIETDYSIKEISETMGYYNPGNFSRAFYKYNGKWPTEYRKERI